MYEVLMFSFASLSIFAVPDGCVKQPNGASPKPSRLHFFRRAFTKSGTDIFSDSASSSNKSVDTCVKTGVLFDFLKRVARGFRLLQSWGFLQTGGLN